MSARALSKIVNTADIVNTTDLASTQSARSIAADSNARDGIGSAAQLRRMLMDIVISLSVPLAAFSAIKLLKFSTMPAIDPIGDGDWSKYSQIAAVVVILVTTIVAFVALAIESRRRKEVESALVETEARVSLCAEATDIGLWQWNSATDEFEVSDHCRDLLSLPAGTAFTVAEVLDTVHPDDRSAVEESMQRGLYSYSGFDVEFRLRSVNERVRWVRLRARPAKQSDAQIARVAGTILDVTARLEMKSEIEQQRESLAHLTRVGMIGKLSSALAHELNQPLTAIMSNAQAAQRIMTKSPLDTNELKSAISDIIQDDARAGEIIRHLRGLLKNNADFLEELDLNAIIGSALELTQGDLAERRISIRTSLSHAPLLIKGDSVQLQQVVLNLVLNGAEAISESGARTGSIAVTSTTLSDGYACVGISDNGPGIKPEFFAKLFDPFFSTKECGLGLGLSISRSIVIRHRGQMWAANNSERGASFYFSIPLVRPGVQ